ncbi:UDP-N-acetylglucosamine 1-carboxyvinyltransferase [Wolbachia endosymbiont of Drosophila melanogaster]|uniref:UDP-N-acetylglucosamine 1-carboxyvinyltransferase n=1 Tax=Wolbachia pipientis wMel TaxID=163164 RepID=MURA_WOLPM|nr:MULTISPECIES: UDP-N-acetylglucosamine 1-carboxyvinyltransferase [Wolbachia]Q73FX6.1 RecName: Full=UDP-N-acetylglucosamine 1-carboxyvinyltransferase; AltName: Full=Enoylpyruvate transferase; AltName: Full=UDP-N-acetylglucosamine enolpyruvyl transferase; Short=EPT [Wolbachia endosymbiont of Drosophila melanogaster]AAS14843.1 UDP-N-acetylglucosamine 1-carboxyvinyltransferase [Wolbachia endosymbiont of Drosophila melanogaster]ERN56241.1 UDP-N-acetylglucosamine 1-carboxyvinyltransferase [Wolbachia
MHKILIRNNYKPLVGKIKINGSKNAVLPIMAASLLSSSSVILHNVPDLIDVHLMSKLLESLGAEVNFMHNKNYKANHTLKIDCSNINNHVMPYKTASKLRTSFLILGPMLSRFGKARTAFPGGCNIGKRPVDMHIKALEEMGAKIEIDGYNIIATVKGKLQGKEITFEKISVGATENVIMAATFAEGVTTINNAATEPEVLDLIDFLKKMGADIEIDNTKVIITGVEALNGCVHKIIPDRIEAGTYALAAIITGGKLELEGINLSDIRCITNELETIGAMVELYDGGIVISRKNGSIKSANVATDPYPNFPSDMQPQLMSAMCIADGISVIEENIFENRFTHADELRKLGANISIEKSKATISGIKSLSGANLYATDLRSTAALVLASLVAGGETIINNSHHLWRGYEAMHEKLNSCGADISISS